MKTNHKLLIGATLCLSTLLSSLAMMRYNTNLRSLKPTADALAEDRISEMSAWWNRNDYVCIEEKCFFYKAQAAVRVEPGTGMVAHAWLCPSCTRIEIIF